MDYDFDIVKALFDRGPKRMEQRVWPCASWYHNGEYGHAGSLVAILLPQKSSPGKGNASV
jgi:hypothetical protein